MTRHFLSLGAGVQSTTMALMAPHGEIGPLPEVAIFADTPERGHPGYRRATAYLRRLAHGRRLTYGGPQAPQANA